MLFMCSYIRVYSQDTYLIKVLKREEIDYYYVYKAVSSKDTLIFLSQKYSDQGSKKIRLKVDKCYEISTQSEYRIKVSNEMYIFTSFGGTNIDNIRISDTGSLPILITGYNRIKNRNCL